MTVCVYGYYLNIYLSLKCYESMHSTIAFVNVTSYIIFITIVLLFDDKMLGAILCSRKI